MPQLILNDVHAAVKRVAGTTPLTQVQLRNYIRDNLVNILSDHLDHDVIIPGDLFDTFDVDADEIFNIYTVLDHWLDRSVKHVRLVLGAGNHDIGKRSDRMSAFGLLSKLLYNRWPDKVDIAETETVYFNGTYVVPHFMNQDLFDLELERLCGDDVEPGIVLLHANVDNHFAEHADHSLNVMEPMLKKLSAKHRLMFAHEHQARTLNYGGHDVIVMGNQWPTSIADCLAHGAAQKDGHKYAHIINDDGTITKLQTWSKELDYADVLWTDLVSAPDDVNFIRITGHAEATQASDLISMVAKFRQKSKALVISNAVKIEGQPDMEEMAEISFERITNFNVMEALLEMLDDREKSVVKGLMQDVPTT